AIFTEDGEQLTGGNSITDKVLLELRSLRIAGVCKSVSIKNCRIGSLSDDKNYQAIFTEDGEQLTGGNSITDKVLLELRSLRIAGVCH
ncbi:MAG: hypothetical protein HON90_02035, partial [Halobacteriovoraceae bacterium]|nr:hypothetical protein [Halobacteriovoraceae bacterium]